MREWTMMLGGLLIWAAHFVLVYVVASMADISPLSQEGGWRMAGLGLTGVCVAAIAVLLWWTVRAREASALARRLGLFGGGLSLIAVIWQALPLLIFA